MYKEIVKHSTELVQAGAVFEEFGQVGIVDIFEHRHSTIRTTVHGRQYMDTVAKNTYFHRN